VKTILRPRGDQAGDLALPVVTWVSCFTSFVRRETA
jgi:hypothetical protein